jgi:PAS domain S-box-containing protein
MNITWRILIVDDDEDEYYLARDMLSETRGALVDLHWAATFQAGEQALEQDHFDAVLMDYDLGAHTGIELIRQANQRGYQAPFILFTGRGSYDVDVEAMKAGATLYVTKSEANPLLLERIIRYAIERKQTEKILRERELALQHSEAQERARVQELNTILDAVPAIVWITRDAQSSRVTGNRAAYEFLRIPANQNPSKSAPEGIAPRNFRVFQEGKELRPEELPLQICAATGQPVWNFQEEVEFDDGDCSVLFGNVSPLLNADGSPGGAVAAFIDISDLNRAEAALAASEENYRTLINAMLNGFILSEMILGEGNKPVDYRFLEVNPAFEHITGLKRDEVIGKTLTELAPTIEIEWLEIYHRAERGGKPVRHEGYMGAWGKWLEVYVYSLGKNRFASLFLDVSHRKAG